MLSNKLTSNIGVPQGSILGPLLFLIYIKALQLITHNNIGGTLLYASEFINKDIDSKELEIKYNNLPQLRNHRTRHQIGQ